MVVSLPRQNLNIFGQNPAFGSFFVKKMCSSMLDRNITHTLLGVKEIAFTSDTVGQLM